MKRVTRLVSFAAIVFVATLVSFAAVAQQQGPKVGIADWNGAQFGTGNPFPMYLVSPAGAATPRWGGPLTGIADVNGTQFGTGYPIPVTCSGCGSTYTGSSPIVVSGTVISCPTCGTSMATVQSVGVATANGLTGTVANPTTTPVITLATSGVSGLLKSVSNGLVSAVAGTDYLTPTGSGAALTGLTWSQIGSTPTTLGGYGITNGATNGANSNITSLTGLTTPLSAAQGGTGLTALGTGVATALADAANATGGFGTVGTSGANVGLLNANKTDSGNNTYSGSTLTYSGLTSGTVVAGSYLGLDASNHLVLGSGGGSSGLTINSTTITGSSSGNALISDGSKLQELPYGTTGNSTLVETTSGGLLTPSILPLATNAAKGAMEGDGQTVTCAAGVCSGTAPNRSTSSSFTVLATDMGGQVNFTGSTAAQTVTIPAISSTVLAAGMTVTVCNQASVTLTISTTPTINGYTASTLPAVSGGSAACLSLTSNGTSLDAIPIIAGGASVTAANIWTAQQSATVTTLTISTSTFTPTGASNDYAITLVHAACPCTLANPSATPVAGTHGIITVTQSSTGSDTIGTYGSQYQAPGGTASITLSTGANAVDTLSYFVKDSTHVLLYPALNFSH